MEQQILDAIEELGGINKEFILEYLTWADSLENCHLQLERPLIRLWKGERLVATLNLESATLALTRHGGDD